MSDTKGVIYILTNPSFPEYVKIGYADDLNQRLEQLNRSECIPFAFRAYATYEVPNRLYDLKVHEIIDKLNPNLRSVEIVNGKTRKREFYELSPEDAYSIFEAMAEIHNSTDKLNKIKPTEEEQKEADTAEEIRKRADNFSFSKCNIEIGEKIEYCDDSSKVATVIDDKHVDYNGDSCSDSSYVMIVKESNDEYSYHACLICDGDEYDNT